MFRPKQSIPPPTSLSETDSLELKIRLSGPTIVKLLSIAVAVLFGSGVLVHEASTKNPFAEPPVNALELTQ